MKPEPSIRNFYELQPAFPLAHGWQLLVVVLLVGTLTFFVAWLSLRDSRKLPRGIACVLVFLRLIALAGLVIYLLNPSQRSESRVVKESRLPVLIDTSLSMGLAAGEEGPSAPAVRIDAVGDWLSDPDNLDELRKDHELMIYRFDESDQPELLVAYPKLNSDQASRLSSPPDSTQLRAGLSSSHVLGWLATGVAAISCFFMVTATIALFRRTGQSITAVWICLSSMMFVAAMILFACSDLQSPELDFFSSVGWISKNSVATIPPSTGQEDGETTVVEPTEIDWKQALTPRGTSTQIGMAIQSLVNRERGGPIAGMIVITDGANNGGSSPARAISAAADAGIPIFPIGVGSREIAKNVQVFDMQAPIRVLPGDTFQIKCLVKAFGLAGTPVQVFLSSVDEKGEQAESIEAETTIVLAGDGEAVPISFSTMQSGQGKRRYVVRIAPVAGERDLRDNERAELVEFVVRPIRVLVMAGGPTREFRFLRNQLYRDQDVSLSVWLQSAQNGADQEADTMLAEFPVDLAALFEFDCIVAFDPDWRALTSEQTQRLERWVAEKAGGMIVIAGPVNTPEWTRIPRGDAAIDNIRRLYPVAFYNQGSAQLKLGRFGGEQPFPLSFSREGRAAEFLWLGDTAADSQSSWSRFAGVFGYYAVNEPKAGAQVLANFADPATAVDDQLPIYLASHYYGAGRVFFQASGEMWRMRRLDVEFFQQYYTKLIRWASQGRLLRNSNRGVLFTDRERCWMGDLVKVQAILTNLQDEPLTVPGVNAILTQPDGATAALVLRLTRMQFEQVAIPGSLPPRWKVTIA